MEGIEAIEEIYTRLVALVLSFLSRSKSLRQASVNETGNEFPFKETTDEDDDDASSAGILVNVDQEDPGLREWVTNDMVPSNVEERSGIDDDNYVVVSEDHVVDGVAHFVATCIISNPRAQNVTPEELQKILTKAFGGGGPLNELEKVLGIWLAGKMFYVLSTWGLRMAGGRAVLKLASKVALQALREDENLFTEMTA